MSKTLSFVTTTREDLFAVSRILMNAIEPQVLFDKNHPLIISIDGCQNSGKSILIDTLRDEMFDNKDDVRFKGKADYDESWKGAINGRPSEISFMNAQWLSIHTPWGHAPLRKISQADELENTFLSLREHGGISVLQNKIDGFEDPRVHIDIQVTKYARDHKLEKPLQDAKYANVRNSYPRHITIHVKNETVVTRDLFEQLGGRPVFHLKNIFKDAHDGKTVTSQKLIQSFKNVLGLGVKK